MSCSYFKIMNRFVLAHPKPQLGTGMWQRILYLNQESRGLLSSYSSVLYLRKGTYDRTLQSTWLSVIMNFCSGLDCVSPQITMWNPNPQCDGNEMSALITEPQRASLLLPPYEDTMEVGSLQSEENFHQNLTT